jgi:hypothetical protein
MFNSLPHDTLLLIFRFISPCYNDICTCRADHPGTSVEKKTIKGTDSWRFVYDPRDPYDIQAVGPWKECKCKTINNFYEKRTISRSWRTTFFKRIGLKTGLTRLEVDFSKVCSGGLLRFFGSTILLTESEGSVVWEYMVPSTILYFPPHSIRLRTKNNYLVMPSQNRRDINTVNDNIKAHTPTIESNVQAARYFEDNVSSFLTRNRGGKKHREKRKDDAMKYIGNFFCHHCNNKQDTTCQRCNGMTCKQYGHRCCPTVRCKTHKKSGVVFRDDVYICLDNNAGPMQCNLVTVYPTKKS